MTQWGLDTLFNPAKRHMDEEKLRLQSTREEVGDASGGKRIDLDSGKVRIAKNESDDEGNGDSENGADQKRERVSGGKDTPAARAAARRARKAAKGT